MLSSFTMNTVCPEKRRRDDVFSSSPLVSWIRSYVGANNASNVELSNGLLLNDVLNHIDPNAFSDLHIQYGIDDVSSRAQNLVEIFNGVKRFYQEKLHQLVVMKVPDMLLLAKEAHNETSYSEMNDILLLILGCAIQCERKQEFIEHIKQLDVDVQRGLVLSIQEITENPDNVIPYRLNELGDMSRDELLIICENLYGHLQSVMEQRDAYIETVIDYVLFRDGEEYSDKRRNSINQTNSTLKAEKERNSILQADLDEQTLIMADMKGELNQLKIQFDSIRLENKHLTKEAALAKTYRDELDVLKAQVEDTNKLKCENTKLKEIAEEVELYKKKYLEMQEHAALLFKQKMMMEEQSRDCVNRIQKLDVLENEHGKLCAQVNLLIEEQSEDQRHIRQLVDQVAKISVEKQESMSACAALTDELNDLRMQKEDDGESNVPFMVEYNHSADLLRLEEENIYLQSIVSTTDGNLDLQSNRTTTHSIKYYTNLIATLIKCLLGDGNEDIWSFIEQEDLNNNTNDNNSRRNIDSVTAVVEHLSNEFAKKGVNIDASTLMEAFLVMSGQYADPNDESSEGEEEEADDEIRKHQKIIEEKEKRIVELEMRLNGVNELTEMNERMKGDISYKEENIRNLKERVERLNELTRINGQLKGSMERKKKEAENMKKIMDEANKLALANTQLKNELVSRDKIIILLKGHLDGSSEKERTNHNRCRVDKGDVDIVNNELEKEIFCKDKTIEYLKGSLGNLNSVSDSNDETNENFSGKEKKISVIKENLDRVKELRYINEQLKDIIQIKEKKVARIKEGLVRIKEANDKHEQTSNDETNEQEVDTHLRETVSNVTELAELNSELRGTLIMEDRTISQLMESVANLTKSAVEYNEEGTTHITREIDEEDKEVKNKESDSNIALQNVLQLNMMAYNFKDYCF